MSKGNLALALITVAVVVAYIEVRLPTLTTQSPQAAEVDLGQIEASIEGLRGDVAQLGERQDRVEILTSAAGAPTVDAPPPADAGRTAAARKPGPAKTEKAKAFLEALKAGNLTREQIDDMWNYLSGSGLESEAIAAFRKWTKEHPKDPEGWYGLGAAQISKLMTSSNQLEVMMLSGAADKAFDAALALDDNHFSARFSKAVSYTFYPSIAGKAPDAIRNFEILVERHGGDSTKKEMEMVYQNLGQEYLKMGNAGKAKAAFERGLADFPDSKVLKEQIGAMEK